MNIRKIQGYVTGLLKARILPGLYIWQAKQKPDDTKRSIYNSGKLY